jgi:hypothetical protein
MYKMRQDKSKIDSRFLGGLFLSILLIFTVIAAASEESGTGTASASGTAIGDYAIVTAESSVSNSEAFASVLAKASASDGRTATAESTAYVTWGDSSAYSHALATAISTIGQTTWAETYAEARASQNSAATKSTSIVWSAGYDDGNSGGNNGGNNGESGDNGGNTADGNGGNGDNGENNGNNGGNNPDAGKGNVPTETIIPRPDGSMFGFSFGKSDPGRYYYFKLVANYNNTGDNTSNTSLRLADNYDNINYKRARAKDYMWSIAWDRGLNQTQFENKFWEVNYTQEVQDIILKEGFP